MKKLLLSFLLIFFTFPVAAVELGVRTGQTFPNFEAKDQNGKNQNLESVMGKEGATFVFFRSADWCPYCQKQLIELNDMAKDFAEAGYPLVGVSYDSVDKLKSFAKKKDINFTLLSDEGSKLIKELGLLNTEYEDKPDHFAYGVPYPAILVMDDKKVVKGVFAEDGYKERPAADAILGLLEMY